MTILLRQLHDDGWRLKNQEGSHRQLVHPTKTGKVTVNGHPSDERNETGKDEMTKYAVIYEPTTTGYSAFAPDLPGCIATGRTLEQTRKRTHDAIDAHLKTMREDGDPIPSPSHVADMLEVA